MVPLEWRAVPGKGRGVFALRAIGAGELLERAPVVVLPADDFRLADRTAIKDYLYVWTDEGPTGAVVLGFGMLYNHSRDPNVRFERRHDELAMDFVAVRDIAEGEEISINYNGLGEPEGVWFEILP